MTPATNGQTNGDHALIRANLLAETVVPSVLDNNAWPSLASTYL